MASVTPPLCLHCQTQPVKRARNNEAATIRGLRIFNGVRWRWFCSRECGGVANGRAQPNQTQVRAWAARRHGEGERRRLLELVQECKAVMTSDGLVPIKAMVKALARRERLAYLRGFDAGLTRWRQQGAA